MVGSVLESLQSVRAVDLRRQLEDQLSVFFQSLQRLSRNEEVLALDFEAKSVEVLARRDQDRLFQVEREKQLPVVELLHSPYLKHFFWIVQVVVGRQKLDF